MKIEASAHLIQRYGLSSPGDVFRNMALWPREKIMMRWEDLQMHSPVAHKMDLLSDLSSPSAK